MIDTSHLQQEIEKIQERNRKVELDKAWETSWFRIIILSAMIYIVAAVFMLVAEISRPWINALVPSIGYFLSEQSLPFIKKWWINR